MPKRKQSTELRDYVTAVSIEVSRLEFELAKAEVHTSNKGKILRPYIVWLESQVLKEN